MQDKFHYNLVPTQPNSSLSSLSSMPCIRHHRRHHTWPHCDSELCMSEPDGLGMNVSTYIPLFFQEAMAAPLSTEEFLCDDMGMPELSRQPKRMPRLWFRSSVKRRSDQSSLSGSSGQTKQAYRSVLRRLTRRPSLGKTRSLFVKSSGSFIMSGLITPHDVAEKTSFLDLDNGRSSVAGDDAAKFMAERRDQRCHSEQPHAWRKPSATLWTLQEQEE